MDGGANEEARGVCGCEEPRPYAGRCKRCGLDVPGAPRAWRGGIGEFMRGKLLHDEALQARLVGLAGDSILEGSELAKWIEAGELSDETLPLLKAALTLRRLRSPDAWTDLRTALDAASELVARDWPDGGIVLPDDDPDLEAFAAVDQRLGQYEAAARAADRIVTEAGYRWNAGSGHLETPTGARPRQFLRDLARGAIRALLADQNTEELRVTIGRELTPFFPPEMLDVSKGSPLYNAVDNALRGS